MASVSKRNTFIDEKNAQVLEALKSKKQPAGAADLSRIRSTTFKKMKERIEICHEALGNGILIQNTERKAHTKKLPVR